MGDGGQQIRHPSYRRKFLISSVVPEGYLSVWYTRLGINPNRLTYVAPSDFMEMHDDKVH